MPRQGVTRQLLSRHIADDPLSSVSTPHARRLLDKGSSRAVDTLHVLRDKYEALCKQACALMPPCCHVEGYTHLPTVNVTCKIYKHLLELLPSKVIEYRKLIARFCGHRVEARDVLDFSVRNFGISATRELVERTLRHIRDSERRARLMLAFVYRFPQIETRCCRYDMCFNCKGVSHEVKCLVRCRECRIMLMKVEGCDLDDCVCGFRMIWPQGVVLRTLYKKKLLVVDIHDKVAVDSFFSVESARGRAQSELIQLW